MAFYDGDIDEDLLVEIPCEFCNDPYPILFLTEHQTGCRYDLVRVNEPTVEEIEEEFTVQEENETRNSLEPDIFNEATQVLETKPELNIASLSNDNAKESPVNKGPNLFTRILQYLQPPSESKNDSPAKVNTSSVKESPKKNQSEKNFHEYEVLEEDLVEEYGTFTLGSIQNKDKRVEEKPSFKMPTIPLLTDSDCKSFNHNDLPDSDNEETESLEQLWEKAKIILAQRSRQLRSK